MVSTYGSKTKRAFLGNYSVCYWLCATEIVLVPYPVAFKDTLVDQRLGPYSQSIFFCYASLLVKI